MRFGTLIESEWTSRPPVGQALFSFSLHGGLLLGAIALSGYAVQPSRPLPLIPVDIYFPSPQRSTMAAPSFRGIPGPSLPTIPVPPIEPVPFSPDLPVSSTQRWNPKDLATRGGIDEPGPTDFGTQQLDGTFLPGEVDLLPRVAPGSRCSGEFPPSLRAAGISGSVVLQFVVGVDGTVAPASVRVIRGSNPAMEQAAVSGLTGTSCRYLAGESHGRPVAVLVQQSIRFALE